MSREWLEGWLEGRGHMSYEFCSAVGGWSHPRRVEGPHRMADWSDCFALVGDRCTSEAFGSVPAIRPPCPLCPDSSISSFIAGIRAKRQGHRDRDLASRRQPPQKSSGHLPPLEFRPAAASRKLRPAPFGTHHFSGLDILLSPPSLTLSLSLRRLISCTLVLGARIRWRHAAPLCSDEAGGKMFRVRQARNGESAGGLGPFGPFGWSDSLSPRWI